MLSQDAAYACLLLSRSQKMAGFAIYAAGFLVSAILSLGIAEVVFLIAKIEFNTRESAHGYQILKTLQTIAKNTAQTVDAK